MCVGNNERCSLRIKRDESSLRSIKVSNCVNPIGFNNICKCIHKEYPSMQQLILIGDSIRMGYQADVIRELN